MNRLYRTRWFPLGFQVFNFFIFLFLIIGGLNVSDARGQDSPDGKLWLAQKVSIERGRWTYIGEIHQRFYDDISKWEELYGNAGIAYRFSESWSVSVFFRLRAEQFNSGYEQIERRPYLNIEYKTPLFGKLDLGFRQRYEYRDFHRADTKHRLTERIRLSYPVLFKSASNPIKLYVSDEIYIPLDTRRISLHEFQLGLNIPTQSSTSWQVFWGHEIKRREGSLNYHTNILGIEVGWNF